HIEDAESPPAGVHRRHDVHAAGATDEEVRDAKRETVALELLGLSDFHEESSRRIRRRDAAVPATKGALARAEWERARVARHLEPDVEVAAVASAAKRRRHHSLLFGSVGALRSGPA